MKMFYRNCVILACAGAAIAIVCQEAKVAKGWTCSDSSRSYNDAAEQTEVESESSYDMNCCSQDACAVVSSGRVLRVHTQCQALQSNSTSATSTPPWCLQQQPELTSCEVSYGCTSSDPECFCHKNKETDPLCQDCHYNYCDTCIDQASTNYKPVHQSRCINCQDAHNIPSIDFVCTQCDNEKGCVTGTLAGQTKNSNEFHVFEMEWYQNNGLWSIRKTTGVAVSTDQNYINNLPGRNGCTDERNAENQCVDLTQTVYQLAYPEPTSVETPSPTPSPQEPTPSPTSDLTTLL
ncbi:hypothetical protein SARC_00786 [Sphaeroforma arctica JP610]|uniref:B box-type domain-containing protein n=1 Tax=Sphaeroforma arctica JP610 TaxID=667725 RepID=A0A0L0GE12_9EUKA|nr:hypothetical protein SARC_00786 [Sphaeroforma arctica JP610]KNC87111.1 hypothetical protein SARC_00786 [Sphaeroforma arctica JP610]|eukprot:XP_014161013.1 hypothetical protein SARC_00786 [Sphaeroforma arctica JP610]